MAAELLRDPERRTTLAEAWTHTLHWNGTDGMPGWQNKLQYVSEILSGLGTIAHVRVGQEGLRAVHVEGGARSLFILCTAIICRGGAEHITYPESEESTFSWELHKYEG